MKSNHNIIVTFNEWLNVISLLLVVASLPFSPSVQRIPLILFGTSSLFNIFLKQQWKQVKWNRYTSFFLLLIALYLVIPISHLLEPKGNSELYKGALHLYHNVLERWMPFALVGILGIFGMSKKNKMSYVAYTYLGVSVVMTIYLFSICDWSYWGESAFRYYLNKTRNLTFAPHMEFNLYLNTSLIFAYYLLMQKTTKRILKLIPIIGMLIIYSNLFFTEGRIGFFSSILLFGVFIAYPLWKKYRKIANVFILGFFILACGLVLLHPRMNRANLIEHNPRIKIWEVGIETILDKPMGYGYCNAKERFFINGQKSDEFVANYNLFLDHELSEKDLHCIHPHNMFLQIMMVGGLVCGLLLLLLFILPVTWIKHSHWIYIVMFQMIFFIQGLFEYIGPHLHPLDYCIGLFILIRIVGDRKVFNKHI